MAGNRKAEKRNTEKRNEQRKSVSIKKYRNRREMNLGILLFALIFIYLVITVIRYVTDDQISIYEVREGSIVKDNTYTGLVLREEAVVYAEDGGYVSYYQNGNAKVKTGSKMYALSQERLDTDSYDPGEDRSEEGGSADTGMNSEVLSGIVTRIQNFNEIYKGNNYSSVYSLKNEVTDTLQNAYSETRTAQLDAVISASGQEVAVYQASQDGIVQFTTDGYEALTKDNFTEDSFDRSVYESITLQDQSRVSAGDPVYRIITGENWSVIVPLDPDTAQELTEEEKTRIQVRIEKDSETLTADLSIIEKDGVSYGCLDFNTSMIRYSMDRYLSVELIMESETGLKIPKSAVIEEEFYTIPPEYLTTGGSSSYDGVLVQDESGATFQRLDIYYTDEYGVVYVSRDDIQKDTVLIMADSTETYTIGDTAPLQGVYNINRGYAVFRLVTILCENDEYYIVREGDNYGLSNYDHIIQNGSGISQEEVVFD